ncbi:triose-phosphate isomerase [bacterium]|nr:triose-phosphate isomerase [bacterium]
MQFIVGNWKMNGTRASACDLARGVALGPHPAGVALALAPPFPFLEAVSGELFKHRGKTGPQIAPAAQDCSPEKEGAFTGDVAAEMLASLGASHVIVGHSERRAKHEETDEVVARKLRAVLRAGLTAIVCVGEVLAERDSGRHEEVVARQVRACLAGQDEKTLERVVLAYEPVWAIGTGRVATPEQAGSMHRRVRETVAEAVSRARAASCVILYGGSVKPDNMAALAATPGIDGALVGGASLDARQFLAIAENASKGEARRPS